MNCHFIFCLHNHQPVGNFEHIFEWAHRDCYSKAIGILKDYPEFKFAIHHSGCLLEWLKEHHPEYINDIREMCERGQVEVLSGGFYEPIFSVISENDVKGQIKIMQDFCREEFGMTPRGFWTAERVWDPEIPRLVSDFDFYYTVLDDIHFRYAGIVADKIYGYYLTERLDKNLGVFPIDRFLRYSIPFKLPGETIEYFRSRIDTYRDSAFVYGDDGEKFGLWPETYQWVYEERWLRNFIEAILKEDWIKMTLPSDYFSSHPPLGRVYLTQGSYFELSEWALPAETALNLVNINKEIKAMGRESDFYPFLKGGVWNNFLIKYHESNAINKRAILLSREIDNFEKENQTDCSDIKRELYRGECNCAYWHGLFGGIYLGNLRNAIYEHILASERMLLERKGIKEISVIERDFWNEGSDQVLLRNENQAVIVVPSKGGMISEFTVYNAAFNLFNVMQRRYEAYHDTLKGIDEMSPDSGGTRSIHERVSVKEKGLEKYLVFDRSRRYSFKDILLKEIPAPDELMSGRAEIFDLGLLEYDCDIEKTSEFAALKLSCNAVYDNKELSISKRYVVENSTSGIKSQYSVSGSAGLYFGVEVNINLLAGHDEGRFFEIEGVDKENSFLDSMGRTDGIDQFSMIDRYNDLKIVFCSSRSMTLIRYPLYTVSQSDSGFEKNFQGTSLLMIFPLDSGEDNFNIEVNVDDGPA